MKEIRGALGAPVLGKIQRPCWHAKCDAPSHTSPSVAKPNTKYHSCILMEMLDGMILRYSPVEKG